MPAASYAEYQGSDAEDRALAGPLMRLSSQRWQTMRVPPDLLVISGASSA
jgi:hypothetical protein